MKATDLMISDWVYNTHNRQNEQVAEIGSGLVMLAYNDLYEYDEIEPIPLTQEILEKNGFVYWKNSDAFIVYAEESYSNQTVEVTLFNVESEFRNIQLHICESKYPQETMLHLMECNYVHQLQHVFRSCGIEKEIIL